MMTDGVAAWSLVTFFAVLTGIAVAPKSRALFFPHYGRRHRLCGLIYFSWLIYGALDLACFSLSTIPPVGYDVTLGVLGRPSDSIANSLFLFAFCSSVYFLILPSLHLFTRIEHIIYRIVRC